ncbi:hypothetical protein, partial [Thiolapillus sp.]
MEKVSGDLFKTPAVENAYGNQQEFNIRHDFPFLFKRQFAEGSGMLFVHHLHQVGNFQTQHLANLIQPPQGKMPFRKHKRVFDLVIDFGTSQSPKSTRPLTTYSCPSRPGHQALHN